MITAVGAAALAAATGLASALLPVVNAEAFVLVAVARSGPGAAWALVLAVALGQTAGKLVLFESARRGATAWLSRLHRGRRDSARLSRWSARVSSGLRSRRGGPALVLTSAVLGLPPLAVVSLAAGAAGQRHLVFGLTCLAGRTARFAALAAPIIWATR